MNKPNSFKVRLSFKILMRFIAAVILYLILLLVLFFGGMVICSFFTWTGNEPLYPILNFIRMNGVTILFLLGLGGFIFIFIYYWRKTIGYLDDVLAATENVYSSKTDLIVLPADLKDPEMQLNQIKLNVRESQRAAQEAEKRKNDLVMYLAHDLKTPLTSVIGYLTLLRDEQEISPELREKYLSISLDKAERLEDLINEFFEITRFNLSGISLEYSLVNLTMMLEQLTYEFQPMLSQKNLKCVLNAQPDIMIKCDPDKLQRVFDNLLRNAVNYSYENENITITASQTQSPNNRIKIVFENKGIDIPKEKLDRIFEQFYRLDASRASKTGGAGLGLAIAKEIVELHKGSITASCSDGVIRFEVTLPI